MTETTGGPPEEAKAHRFLEGTTMALYVSIVLLAAMVAINEDELVHDDELFYLIWGTTLGLAIAHWVAFTMASRLVHGRLNREDLLLAASQLSGAGAVAVVCTVPVLLLPGDTQADVVRLVLGFILGLTGYMTARHVGAGAVRSAVAGGIALLIGLATAVIKNVLSGH